MASTRSCMAYAAACLLAACQGPSGGSEDGMVTAEDAEVFDGIAPGEVVKLTGTEPFWGGEVADGQFRYSTPENIEGETIPVERFAGNNGLSFSGERDGKAVDLAVTPGECSDGMSDRTYPFVATLSIGDETRGGCAWTEAMPFTGSEAP